MNIDQPGFFQTASNVANQVGWKTSVEESAKFFLQQGGDGGGIVRPRLRAIERARLKWGRAEVMAMEENEYMSSYDIDLGSNHYLTYFSWEPDRDLNPQYDGIGDEPKAGATIYHKKPDGSDCAGAVNFDTPNMQKLSAVGVAAGHPARVMWKVLSWDPLTLDPSIACSCGDHGYIREGKWVPA